MMVKDWTPSVLGYIVTVGFFGLLAYLATHDVPNTSERILDVMIGSLGTAWIGIINYYYGSSSGSSRKTELLAQALEMGSDSIFKEIGGPPFFEPSRRPTGGGITLRGRLLAHCRPMPAD